MIFNNKIHCVGNFNEITNKVTSIVYRNVYRNVRIRMYNRSCHVYMSGISEMKGILTWELLRNGGIRKKALLCRLFRGIHCWTVFRDRLTGRGLREFPGAWLNFTKFP